MPAFARREIVAQGAVGFYHCICRCEAAVSPAPRTLI